MYKRAGILLFALALLGVLFFVDPGESAFMPRCLFRRLTGLDCPSCGIQRAIHALLHLRLREAWGYNLFLVVSLPYVAALVATHGFGPRGRLARLKRFCRSRAVVYAYLVLFFAWWIVRNVWGI